MSPDALKPLFLTLTLLGAAALLWIAFRCAVPRLRRRGCATCGYDVRALDAHTCPECGSDLRRGGIVSTRIVRRTSVHPVIGIVAWTAAVLILMNQARYYGFVAPVRFRSLNVYTATLSPRSGAYSSFNLTIKGEGNVASSVQPPESKTIRIVGRSSSGSLADIRLDLGSGRWTLEDASGARLGGGASVDAGAVGRWMEAVGVDASQDAQKAEAADLTARLQAVRAGGSPYDVSNPSDVFSITTVSGFDTAFVLNTRGPLAVLGWALWVGLYAVGIVAMLVVRRRFLRERPAPVHA